MSKKYLLEIDISNCGWDFPIVLQSLISKELSKKKWNWSLRSLHLRELSKTENLSNDFVKSLNKTIEEKIQDHLDYDHSAVSNE